MENSKIQTAGGAAPAGALGRGPATESAPRRLIVTDEFPLELIDLPTAVEVIPFLTEDPVDYVDFVESQVDEIVNLISDERIVEELRRRGVSVETWARSRVPYLDADDLVLVVKMKDAKLVAWLVSVA